MINVTSVLFCEKDFHLTLILQFDAGQYIRRHAMDLKKWACILGFLGICDKH